MGSSFLTGLRRGLLPALVLSLPALVLGYPTITLIYDDSRNPAPFAELYYCVNVEPETGAYLDDWGGFIRQPMFDDGEHGDGGAGDHVWGVQIKVEPHPGRLVHWATDDDTDSANDWLGTAPSFLVDEDVDKSVRVVSMPEEALLDPDEVAERYGLDLSRARRPSRVGETDMVVFTHFAPNAEKVFLASSFNHWARNNGGVVSDHRWMLFPAGNGVWYRIARVQDAKVSYKYVERTAAGEFRWVPDTFVPTKDADDNSVVELADLPIISKNKPEPTTVAVAAPVADAGAAPADATPTPAAPRKVEWKPYAQFALWGLLETTDQALVYVRIKDNARCKAFERDHLLSTAAMGHLTGKTVLFVEASDAEMFREVQKMGVIRVPALAMGDINGKWQTLMVDDKTTREQVLDFLGQYRGAKSE